MELVLKNVRLARDLSQPGIDTASAAPVSILVRDGVIVEVSSFVDEQHADRVIDGEATVAFTGFVDLHTHLREPGFEQSETVLTGTQAAAAGGFTTVFAMANTSPVQDTAGVVEQVHTLGRDAGYATVRPIGAVTVGLEGEKLSEIGAMAQSRAQVRVFSDDGKCVHDSLLMRRALEYVSTFGGVIAQHAQDPRLTENAQMNEGVLSSELGLAGWPAVAEESIIARDVLLAEHLNARLHVCHISTAGSVEVIRWAKARGIQVTAEVTPHHLLLTEEKARSYNPVFKVNPPLRRDTDVHALRQAVAEGLVDILATDHAPHPQDMKEGEWQTAAFGMVGLESAYSVAQKALLEPGHVSFAQLEDLLSHRPAEIGDYPLAPKALQAGEVADITLVDPSGSSEFDLSRLYGRSTNSPFLGLELPGRVHTTVHRGWVTYHNGELAPQEEVSAAAASDSIQTRSETSAEVTA